MSTANELRKKYLKNPPEGSSKEEIEQMDDEDLLDLEYFMNEDLDNIFGIPTSNTCILEGVQFKCKKCGCTEYIPKNVVVSLASAFGGHDFPPTFSCEKCHIGTMFPINYKF